MTLSRITKVTEQSFELVLPLIADYQRFYGATPDEASNREHFSQFLDNHDRGIQFVALSENGDALGFATVYFQMSSLAPGIYCVMNDLFTVPRARGKGLAKALIYHSLNYANSRGFGRISWQTAQSNIAAQHLYDGLAATRTMWINYELERNE